MASSGREVAVTSGKMFGELNALRNAASPQEEEEARQKAEKEKMNETIFATMAQNKYFEIATLGVIVINALFLGYDTEYTARYGYSWAGKYLSDRPEGLYKQDVGFPFMENFFCVYFTIEVAIRFMAFRKKQDCIWDAWFVFDSLLVGLMILETWVFPFVLDGGNMAMLGLLRLLRLARIARMGKLMRFFPELAIIVKGMAASVRSVWCAAALIFLITYVFAIIFTDAYHQGLMNDEEASEFGEHELFGSLGKSMRHLFIMGTILDDITACTNTIRSTSKSTAMMLAFVVFVLVSSFTMFNMLIGILCEVVTATSDNEKAKAAEIAFTEAITKLFKKMDQDANGAITREEFMTMKDDSDVLGALESLDVEEKHFEMYAELMFDKPPLEGEEPDKPHTMSLADTIEVMQRLRPGQAVSALDFGSFRMEVTKSHLQISSQIGELDSMMSKHYVDDEEDDPGFAPSSWEAPDGPALKMSSSASLAELAAISEQDILDELQRRVGKNADISNNGDQQGSYSKEIEALEALCAPHTDHDGEAWSKETYTC